MMLDRAAFNSGLLALKRYISSQLDCDKIELIRGSSPEQSDSLRVQTRQFSLAIGSGEFTHVELEVWATFSHSYEAPVILFRIYAYRQGELAEERSLSFERHILESLVGADSGEGRFKVPLGGKGPKLLDMRPDPVNENIALEDIDEFIEGENSPETLDRAEKSLEGGGPPIEITDYDNFGVYYFIHPCQTRQLIDQEDDSDGERLRKWWDFYSGPILWRMRSGNVAQRTANTYYTSKKNDNQA